MGKEIFAKLEPWQRVQLVYIFSPGNPTGAVMGLPALQELIELADRHDFIIASDECYSELYFDEAAPPPGLLQAARTNLARQQGRTVPAIEAGDVGGGSSATGAAVSSPSRTATATITTTTAAAAGTITSRCSVPSTFSVAKYRSAISPRKKRWLFRYTRAPP